MKQQVKYSSLACFLSAHRLPGKREGWRLCESKLGSINALPESRGILVATDGILCLIERWDGTLFEGHLQWFEAEHDESEASPTSAKRLAGLSTKQQHAVDKAMEEFLI